jgi:hypothetical protein
MQFNEATIKATADAMRIPILEFKKLNPHTQFAMVQNICRHKALVALRLPEYLLDAIKSRAKENHCTVSEEIRMILNGYFLSKTTKQRKGA